MLTAINMHNMPAETYLYVPVQLMWASILIIHCAILWFLKRTTMHPIEVLIIHSAYYTVHFGAFKEMHPVEVLIIHCILYSAI